MSRRSFLKKAGLAGLVGFLGASAVDHYHRLPAEDDGPAEPPDGQPQTEPSPDEQPILAEEDFGEVVDVVDAGADPEGEEPINPVIQDAAGDDTLLSFPPGTYAFDRLLLDSHSRFGFTAAGDERPTLVPSESDCYGGLPYLLFDGVADLLLSDLAFDFRDASGGGAIHLYLTGESVVRDVRAVGNCANQFTTSRIDVRDPEGTALVENLEARNVGGHRQLGGVFVGRPHAGELTFRDCTLEGFADNGLYASAPGLPDGEGGTVHVDGGTFANNNIANVRLGSAESTARGVTVRVDTEPPGWDVNARGIRLRGDHDQVVADCSITIGERAGPSFGGIVFHAANGGATVTGTAVQVDRDATPAVRAIPPDHDPQGTPEFDDLTVSGNAAGESAVVVAGRDGATFRNCTIEQSGQERDGVVLADSTDCRLVDSRIEVRGRPLVLENATLTVENTTVVTPDGRETIEDAVFENEVVTPS